MTNIWKENQREIKFTLRYLKDSMDVEIVFQKIDLILVNECYDVYFIGDQDIQIWTKNCVLHLRYVKQLKINITINYYIIWNKDWIYEIESDKKACGWKVSLNNIELSQGETWVVCF